MGGLLARGLIRSLGLSPHPPGALFPAVLFGVGKPACHRVNCAPGGRLTPDRIVSVLELNVALDAYSGIAYDHVTP